MTGLSTMLKCSTKRISRTAALPQSPLRAVAQVNVQTMRISVIFVNNVTELVVIVLFVDNLA